MIMIQLLLFFNYAKYILGVSIISVLIGFIKPYMIAFFMILINLFFLFGAFYFYIKIVIKRSRDAGVKPKYIIIAYIATICVLLTYFVLVYAKCLQGKDILAFFANRFCLTILQLLTIYNFVLIALPSKENK